MKTRIIPLGIIAVVLVQILSGCGGSTRPVMIALSPTSVVLDQGATQQFTATVTGTRITAVVWNGGSISAAGLYTAPAIAGTFQVSATSAADPKQVAIAVVTVREASLTVSPDGYSVLYQYRCEIGVVFPACGTFGPSFEMSPGATQQFTATVTGTVHQNVAWSVQEGAAGGSISSGGIYTAPATAGTFHIVANAGAMSVKIPVTVEALAVFISPSGAGLWPGKTHIFTAVVDGSMDDRVSWAVQEGTAGGAITGEGRYTAPMERGEYHIVATSMAHPEISARAAVAVTDSGFTNGGEMAQARSFHTATLLPNGDVLLAGGNPGSNTAEIWDHATSSFRATGSMAVARRSQTATLLPSGKVLITGGSSLVGGYFVALDSAELYDPATGQFVPLGGRMSVARSAHTATLLENGKVLITGGFFLYGPHNTAELYDPATETFTPTGSLITWRWSHSATLLPDGRVLVAGGGLLDATAEIYDPSNGEFAAAGSFRFSRYSHTATLLPDSRVLLGGGTCHSAPLMPCDDALIFDPSSGQFSAVAEKMNDHRSDHTATLLPSGYVLLAGGWPGSPVPVGVGSDTAELFNPTTSIFRFTGSMAQPRWGHTATLLLDGRVLIAGGTSDKSAEFYTEFYTQ